MTNREWLESLSDEQLASFLTAGILFGDNYHVSIRDIALQYTQSVIGVGIWLKQPCCYAANKQIGEKDGEQECAYYHIITD